MCPGSFLDCGCGIKLTVKFSICEVGTVHLLDQRNRLKVRGMWCRVVLVDCCGWVVNQDGVLYQKRLCVKGDLGVGS